MNLPADSMKMVIPEAMYGSDRAGLVCAYQFTPDHPARSIDADEASRRLAEEPSTWPGFLWLHFSLTNAATEPWLRRHVEMPETFYESTKGSSSTRAASTVSLYVARRILVSARTTQLRAIDRLRASVKAGEAFRSPTELMAHLLRDQADVLVDIVRDVTRQVDAIEDRIIAHQTASRPKLGALRRVLVRLQRLLAPEPAALFRLLNRPPAWLSERDVSDLRQSAEELSAAVSDSAALVERIRLLQEELIALLNEQINRTLFILTSVTVLALPLMIIPGLFGMNVRGIPFSESETGFWTVFILVLAVAGLGAALAWPWRTRP
jgi:zinc transporter